MSQFGLWIRPHPGLGQRVLLRARDPGLLLAGFLGMLVGSASLWYTHEIAHKPNPPAGRH